MTEERDLTVLVLGVGGQVSQGIVRALRHGSRPVRIVGACVSPLSTGLYVCDTALVSPNADEPGFVEWVADTCAREGVRAVLSGVEPVLDALAPHARELAQRTGAVLVASPPDVLAVGRDKLETARWLESRGLPFAPSADAADGPGLDALVERAGFPLIAKPRRGRASRGVVMVEDEGALERIRGQAGHVVQQLLGDPTGEFTAGCFVDREGAVRGTIVMRRTLATGTTASARIGAHPQVSEVAERVCAELRPVGPCNVQMRVHDGVPTPFELNVRFSGTTPIRTHFGFAEVDAALSHLVLGRPAADLPPVTSGVALRYWNELYPDEGTLAALERDGAADAGRGRGSVMGDWGP